MTENPWSLKSISSAIFVGIIVTVLGGFVLAWILQSDRFDPARNVQGVDTVVTKVVTVSPTETEDTYSILVTDPASIAPLPRVLPPRFRLKSNAAVHQGPGTLYPISATLVTGEEVTVIAQDAYNVWYYIQRDDGRAGWIERASGYLLNPDEMSSIPEIKPDFTWATVEADSTVVNSFPETPTSAGSPRSTSAATQNESNLPIATPSSAWVTPTLPSGSQILHTPLPPPPPRSTIVLELSSTSAPSFQPTTPPVVATERAPTPTPDIPPTADTP